jgi:hypothetical protein
MSSTRCEQIIRYAEAIHECYEQRLTAAERAALHAWEDSDAFTRTDDWPGWARHIGLRPGLSVQPRIVRSA